jgi:general secretion pathway protein K
MIARRCLQRGAALLVAMLVAALAAAVAVTLASGQERWRATVEHRRDQVQAQALAIAGIQWARQVIQDDAGSPLDHLGEVWALPLPPTPVENGSIEGRIVDAQGLLNVNNLAREGAAATSERARLERLFTRLGLAPAALDAVADWVDDDDLPRATGAEDAWYQQQPAPSFAANAPVLRLAELAGVRGLSPAAIAALAPYVTALPPPTPLNVNTASPEVLAAAIGGLDGDRLASLVTGRAQKPFTTVAEFRARLPSGTTLGDASAYSVSTRFFIVTVRARQGATVAQARALLRREGAERPAILWQVVE